MRTLRLLRHAKSDWDDPHLADQLRPLNRRGKRDAKRLARHLAREAIRVDLVLCSPALRARRTLEPILPALEGAVREEEALYGATAEGLLALVRRLPKTHRSVLLIGHNPGFEELARLLLPASEASPDFPTCALATLTFEVDSWAAVTGGSGRLESFLVPGDRT